MYKTILLKSVSIYSSTYRCVDYLQNQLAHFFLDNNKDRDKICILEIHYALVFTPELAKARILSSEPEREGKAR